MRHLRSSMYRPGESPVTVVQPEDSLISPIEVAATVLRQAGYPGSMDVEIFEGPDDLVEATLVGNERAQTRLTDEERHAGTLHDWAVALLYSTTPTGRVQTTEPAPLDSGAVKEVLLDVSLHPEYHSQSFRIFARDGKSVELKDGRVAVWD